VQPADDDLPHLLVAIRAGKPGPGAACIGQMLNVRPGYFELPLEQLDLLLPLLALSGRHPHRALQQPDLAFQGPHFLLRGLMVVGGFRLAENRLLRGRGKAGLCGLRRFGIHFGFVQAFTEHALSIRQEL
jgi:hypothetical protein